MPGTHEKDTDYQKFFKQAMKKFGVKSPEDLEGDEKKKFYDYVDRNYKAKNENFVQDAMDNKPTDFREKIHAMLGQKLEKKLSEKYKEVAQSIVEASADEYKTDEDDEEEVKGYKPRSKGEEQFMKLHKITKKKHPVAGDDQFQAKTTKTAKRRADK